MQTQLLKVTGMTCGGCVNSVRRVLQSVAGVADVEVSLAAEQATVHYDEGKTGPAELRTAVLGAGFGVDDQAPS